ncbi:MAG: hypothetical protein JNK60_06825, partial [Acidobacteria bacterium]|nr:hypothetical protein [Acidobacteriota bacterium]
GSYTSFINNAQYGYIWYGWTDGNNDHIAQRSEVNFNNILYAYNINPDCPTCPNPNRVNPDLKGPTTQEIVLGFEHELFTGLAVSVNGTYRKMNDLVWFQNFGLNPNGSMHLYTRDDFELSDYVEGTDVNGNPYRIPYYGLKATAPGPTGRYLSNRPDYSQQYKGIELQLNKRYADNWSARFGFSYNDWTQDVGSGAFFDPSNQLNQTVYGSTTGGSIDDGGPVVYNVGVGSGAKGNVYINSKWQMNVNALYTLPWGGLNVAGNFFARQGYPILFIDTNGDPGDGLGPRNLLINPIGTKRNPTVANLDLRLEKPIKIQNITLSLSVDAFNVLNSNVTLQRKSDVSQSSHAGGDITEVQSPRVFRFGGRITF